MKPEALRFLDIILEELNVKEIVFTDEGGHITETYDGNIIRTDQKYGRIGRKKDN